MIEPSLPVRVFKNLKHGCYSIMQAGKLQASARQVRLANVEFRVREAGRQRMLREDKPNIHAFAVGYLVDFVHPVEERALTTLVGRDIAYRPKQFATFVDAETHAPITNVAFAQFNEDGVTYSLDDAERPREAA